MGFEPALNSLIRVQLEIISVICQNTLIILSKALEHCIILQRCCSCWWWGWGWGAGEGGKSLHQGNSAVHCQFLPLDLQYIFEYFWSRPARYAFLNSVLVILTKSDHEFKSLSRLFYFFHTTTENLQTRLVFFFHTRTYARLQH